MPDKEPIAYETWEIISSEPPPHSHLYALEPIGIGTPWVESLTGYIARLAEAHCVSTGVLLSKEIVAVTGRRNIFTCGLKGNVGYSTYGINGRGVRARDFVRALESLTCQPGLRYLTLLPWEEVLLSQSGLQRRMRTWCGQCLRMWQAKGMPVYEPLLWTLIPVTLCPLHQQTLSCICPSCNHHNGVLDRRTRPGHCSRCEQWLAPPTTANALPDNRVLTHDDLSWGDWVATVLGEILAAGPRLPFVPRGEGIAQTIRLCIERIADGSAAKLACELEVGPHLVFNWRHGKALPRLPLLLGLSSRLGISLLELIKGAPDSVPRAFIGLFPSQLRNKQLISRKPRKRRCQMQPANVLPILQAAMNESPPPSVRQVIKRTNHGSGNVYRYFPKECRSIAQRFADYRKAQVVVRRDRARAEIREAAYQLHAKGLRITHKNLLPFLSSSSYFHIEEVRSVLCQVAQELQQVGDPRS